MTTVKVYEATLKRSYPLEPLESSPCPLCDRQDDYVLAEIGLHDIPARNVICKGCGLIRIDPRMTKENYELFYKEDFFDYLNPYARPGYVDEIEKTTDESFETTTRKLLLPYLLPYVKQGGKVLDIGAGFGAVLYLLKKEKDITPVGIEPDPYARGIAKERMGITLRPETAEEFFRSNEERFDFVVLNQVFEHLLDPAQTLKDLAHVLTKEGVIYIGVPNTYDPRVPMGMFYQIAHTYNYTPHTLRLLGEKAGLKIISVRSIEANALEVMLAHKSSSYEEAPEAVLRVGSDWRKVVARLSRKRRLNLVRGFAKRVTTAVFGQRVKDFLQRGIDKLIRYRY